MAKPKKVKGKKGGDAGKNDEQKDKVLEVDKEWYLIQIRSGPTEKLNLFDSHTHRASLESVLHWICRDNMNAKCVVSSPVLLDFY